MGEPYWPDDATPEQISRAIRRVDRILRVKPGTKVRPTPATPSAPSTSKATPKKYPPKG